MKGKPMTDREIKQFDKDMAFFDNMDKKPDKPKPTRKEIKKLDIKD